MLILGFSGGTKSIAEDDPKLALHDGAAVLLRDGEVVAAIEEERLDRLKHSNCFPSHAIRYCLDAAGVLLTSVDIITTNDSGKGADWRSKQEFLWGATTPARLDGASFLSGCFERAFGVDVSPKLRFCHHHIAHAASAFVPSGFEKALILTVDGDGDGLSGMVLTGDRDGLQVLREFPVRQSLGHFYMSVIALLGYGVFDEYKVMGLAPYGDPAVLAPLFERLYTLKDGGEYDLAPLREWFHVFDCAGFLARARRKSCPFTQWHKDFAAALQATVEKILLHIVEFYGRQTGLKHLCLAGGVAHNCTANGRILYSGLFDKVFVQPAAHDAGGALGAALESWSRNQGHYTGACAPHVYWGTGIGKNETAADLDRWSSLLDYEVVDDVAGRAADLIAQGAVIGWVQGRSEFGPRALGNRSILADPRPAANRDRVNRMVKKREGYRPFAPSVPEEDADVYFELPPNQKSFPFMIFVLRVKPEARRLLGAISHVDGSARVQTVSQAANPLYWKLLREFGELTGVPVLLNTSFNNAWEPIVDSVEDAINCYLTTGLDYLIVGNCIAVKKFAAMPEAAAVGLIPSVAAHYRLAMRAGVYELVSMKSHVFCSPQTEISRTTFRILQEADGRSDLATIARNAGCGQLEEALPEILRLWEERFIRMQSGESRP